MKYTVRSPRTMVYGSAAVAFLLASVFTPLFGAVASAAQVSSRSIQISNSTPGATGVTYNVTFTPATTVSANAEAIIDFCDNSPLPGDSCSWTTNTAPVTTSVSGSGVTATSLTGNHTVKVVTSGAFTSGTPATLTLNNITNPGNPNQSFYARIYTYASGGSAAYTPGTSPTLGSYVDYGGVALSTASNVIVTAKVQEQLSFCVYIGGSCASGTSAGVALGNNNGVLSSSNPLVDRSVKYDISTNAASGATVRLKGDTLKSGANSIAAIGATPSAWVTNTSQFGLCSFASGGVTANLTVATKYNNSSNCNTTTQTAGTSTTTGNTGIQFAYDTNASTGTLSTYGDSFASQVAGGSATGTVAMLGGIAAAQAAGVYTTTIGWIATGTY